MAASRTLLGLAVAAAGLGLAACSSSGPDTTVPSGSPVPAQPTTAGLPFHYQALGESSSPTFRVGRDGTYTIAYTLKGSTDQPGCVVSMSVVGPDGSTQRLVSGVKLQPADTRQDSASATLTAGEWRFQEAGGCSWSVSVSTP
jgi:hypothetical protein